MLIDTHAHLDFPDYAIDRDDVLARAWEAGLSAILSIGIDEPTSRAAVALAEGNPRIFASAGIHPHEVAKAGEDAYRALEELAHHPRVVALGEMGLDYHYEEPPRQVQKEAFRRQLHLARRTGLPVVIHARDAHEDVLEILREEAAGQVRGVMHCFAGEEAVARACLDLGFYISFAGPVTFKSAEATRRVAATIPLDRLLTETDSPFLSPHPLRGKRNEPARVALVAEELARVHGLTPAELGDLTADNARRLFRLPADHADAQAQAHG